MEELEKLVKQIESEQDFEKVVELFSKAAIMVKEKLSKATSAKGKITEIVRDLDSYIEKEITGDKSEC